MSSEPNDDAAYTEYCGNCDTKHRVYADERNADSVDHIIHVRCSKCATPVMFRLAFNRPITTPTMKHIKSILLCTIAAFAMVTFKEAGNDAIETAAFMIAFLAIRAI